MAQAIIIRDFTKHYGDVLAVDELTLEVEESELFGMIGPDGAGKTTTMRTLCTLLPVEQGHVSVAGLDVTSHVAKIRSLLGYMPQRFSLYPDLSVEQNLLFFADLFQVPKKQQQRLLAELYRFSRLEPFKHRLAKQLSGGMKQKLALSCTLIHKPQVLILDEPTTGVDPVSRREFWNILQKLRDDGVTILVSTPYMDEADLCDRVAFIHQGKMLAVDRPADINRNFPDILYEILTETPQDLIEYFQAVPDCRGAHMFGDRLHVSFNTALSAAEITKHREHAPVPVQEFHRVSPSIEDTFMALMHNRESERPA